MRQKREAVLCFESNDEGLPKVVRDYRARYRAISQVLDRNPEVLDLVDRDLRKLSQGGRKGRKGDFTSESILRALIVQEMEGLPFREAVIRMGGDGFLQDFLRTRKKAVMDFTFLDKCSLTIRPETWKRVNELLGRYGVRRGMVNPKVIRTDTTVMESNIHYPTDASLLWDTWRVASRLLKRAREISPESVPQQEADCNLTEPVIQRHEKLFGQRPVVLAADKGFCPEKSKFEELAKLVENLAIPRRMQDLMDKLLVSCQAFRAGIEGTISGLKRAFRWFRCFFRGFKGFARNVGLGVFCHNLIILAENEPG